MYKTPKKLKKINIMGRNIVIVIDDQVCASAEAMGVYTNGIIVLLSEYKCQTDFVDTFTHECFHALNDVLGSQLDNNVEEILANTMGQINVHIINEMLKLGVFNKPPEK